MTTTATTTNTSASTSTPPGDSPVLHVYDDNDDDDEKDRASKSSVEPQNKPEHNHNDQKCQKNLEQLPSPQQPQPPPPPPPSQNRPQSPSQLKSTKTDASDAPISPTNATTITTEPSKQATISSTPTTATDSPSNNQLEQSTSSQQQLQQSTNNSNNSTEQKRPMNAFLLFCKRQRSQVKEKYPNLENRGITKILGDWWSKLDKEQKSKYTDLARQHKEAFMKANPDFKWCKTPNVSNINNNISINDTDNESCSNSSTNQHQQKQSQHSQRLQQNNRHPSLAANVDPLSSQPTHHPMEVVYHSSNSMDIMLKSRQQLEAPKPPKKRFLERNDSVYTSKNNYGPNHNDSNSHGTDVVPFSLDQNFLDRVIDKAFSEDSSSSPSGVNSCKCSNRNATNLTTSSNNPTSFSSSSTTNYATNIDEPVDFSMNKTFSATSQQIINNLVEKMLSEGPDNSSSFSKINGTDSVRPQIKPPVKRDNPDDTR